MIDYQTITTTSNNLTFSEFVAKVAKSNPQIGNGYMGNVSFTSGLPSGLTGGKMTVISYGDKFIKFILDVESTPNHYECYRLSDGTITDWTTGQGGGGDDGTIMVTADITNIDIENNRFYFENLSEEPATIWDLVVNQNKRVVIELSWTNKDGRKIMQLLNVTSTIESDNGLKTLLFENNNLVLFGDSGIMALEFGFFDGLWGAYGAIQLEENGGATELMTNVTWSDLKSLRDGGGLVPGMQYRITDYECSTSQEYTQSANNMFDIIVTADDERTLNENARACKRDWENFFIHAITFERIDNAIIVNSKFNSDVDSETLPLNPGGYHSAEEGYDLYGLSSFAILVPNDIEDKSINCTNVYMADFGNVDPDYGVHSSGTLLLDFFMNTSPFVTYFDKSNLSAWELKYCLDNDKTRFDWAQEGEADEYYHSVKIVGTDDKDYIFRTTDETEGYWWVYNIDDPSVVGYIKTDLDPVTSPYFILYNDNGLVSPYGYPFGTENPYKPATVKEITLVDIPGTPSGKGVIYYMKDEFGNESPYDFKNIQFFKKINNNEKYWYTFTDTLSDTGEIIDGSLNLGSHVRQNVIGAFIQNNTQYLKSNIFCAYKLYAINNVLGANCSGNVFVDATIEGNVFGKGCQGNVFNNDTFNNTFGVDCKLNEFAKLSSSTFGNGCTQIDSAYSKREINNCIFGDKCYGIVPVNCDFKNMTFGNGCSGLPISSDSGILPNVSSGWIFDAGVGVGDAQGTITGITLNDKNNEQLTYTLHKRVTQTGKYEDNTLMIYSIREYIDSNTNKDYVKLLYPSGGRGGVIVYNSNSEITGDWIDTNTDTTQNTYNSETGDGTLQLNEGVTEIGGEVPRVGLRAPTVNSPFFMNANVRSVDMSQSGLTKIDSNAFESCTNLSNVVMPNTVTAIGDYAFRNCTLMSVDIPDTVMAISANAFDGTINVNYTGTASGTPWGAQYVNAPTDKDSGLMFGNFKIKDNNTCSVIGCTSTGKEANIVIPKTYNDGKDDYSVTAIGDYAFRNCTNILSITIPDSVTSIGSYIFDGCYTMKEKDKVSTIQSVTELSSSVPSTTALTFASDCMVDYLYVPTDDAVTLYTAAWNKYFKTISTQKKSPSEER